MILTLRQRLMPCGVRTWKAARSIWRRLLASSEAASPTRRMLRGPVEVVVVEEVEVVMVVKA